MLYKQRKRIQRKVNRLVREMNKAIEKDELWLGRFYARQTQSYWIEYDDHSGGNLLVYLVFYDRKTGKTLTDYFHYFSGGSDIISSNYLYRAMNSFIVDYCKVWNANPAPSYQNAINYTKEKRK